MGQDYYLARSTGALNVKDQRKCTVRFEDEGVFPKVHWRIFEDSGRYLTRIPRRLGLKKTFFKLFLLEFICMTFHDI